VSNLNLDAIAMVGFQNGQSPACKTRYSSGSSSSESFGLIPPPPPDSDDSDESHSDDDQNDKSINRIDFPNPRYNRSFISESIKSYGEENEHNVSIVSRQSLSVVSTSSNSKNCRPNEHSSSHSIAYTASSRSVASRDQTTVSQTARSELQSKSRCISSVTSETTPLEKDECLISDLFDLLPENQSISSSSSDSGHFSSTPRYPPTDDSSNGTDADDADRWSIRLGLLGIFRVSSTFALRCAVDHWKCFCTHERILQSLGAIDRISIQTKLRAGFRVIVSLIDSQLTLSFRSKCTMCLAKLLEAQRSVS
jgi:hypothetical protein